VAKFGHLDGSGTRIISDKKHKHMKQKENQRRLTPAATKPLLVEHLDQLQALVDRPVMCRFALDQQEVELPCKRLTAEMDEVVRGLKRQAQPPFIKDRGDYDYTNQAYLKLREENERKARSLLVYWGCPAVAAKKPGLTNQEEIHKFVREILAENILEMISLTVQGGGLDVTQRVNFTSPGNLES
jgi:hypothetical protein